MKTIRVRAAVAVCWCGAFNVYGDSGIKPEEWICSNPTDCGHPQPKLTFILGHTVPLPPAPVEIEAEVEG